MPGIGVNRGISRPRTRIPALPSGTETLDADRSPMPRAAPPSADPLPPRIHDPGPSSPYPNWSVSILEGERLMRNRATVLHTPLAALVLPMLLAVTPALGADGSAGKGSRLTEMPMHVQTEGTSYNEYRQHQAELQTRLAGSLPAAALGAPVRIELTRQEIDGIEKTPHVSGTPLTIGLVKAVAPRVDLDGLETGAGDAGRPARGRAERDRGRDRGAPVRGQLHAHARGGHLRRSRLRRGRLVHQQHAGQRRQARRGQDGVGPGRLHLFLHRRPDLGHQ